MGATYLSMQLHTTDRDAAIAALEDLAAADPAAGLRFYVAEPLGEWLAVFPNFTPELERTATELSARLRCLVWLLLSADEDDLYSMFFHEGKQLPWFKLAVGRARRGKEREKLAAKVEALADACDAERRARIVEILAESTGVIFASEVLQSVCEVAGIGDALTSFEYLQRGEQDGLASTTQPTLVPG